MRVNYTGRVVGIFKIDSVLIVCLNTTRGGREGVMYHYRIKNYRIFDMSFIDKKCLTATAGCNFHR